MNPRIPHLPFIFLINKTRQRTRYIFINISVMNARKKMIGGCYLEWGWLPQLCRQLLLSHLCGFEALGLDTAVQCQYGPARLRQDCCSPFRTASLGLHEWHLETAIHRTDQHPRAHVGHSHRLGGRRDRSRFANGLQQIRLARTNRNIAPAIEPWPDLELGTDFLTLWAVPLHGAKTGKIRQVVRINSTGTVALRMTWEVVEPRMNSRMGVWPEA